MNCLSELYLGDHIINEYTERHLFVTEEFYLERVLVGAIISDIYREDIVLTVSKTFSKTMAGNLLAPHQQ